MSTPSWHHPDYSKPRWVLLIKNFLWHKVVTMIQRMNPTQENIMYIRQFIDALEWEYLQKRAVCDVEEGIGQDSDAVKKALKAFAEDREEV